MHDYLTPLKMIPLCTMYSDIGSNVLLSVMFEINVSKKGIKFCLCIFALSLNMNRSIAMK